MASSGPTAFDRAIAHRALGDGRFAIEVPDGWGTPVGPNGGYVCAALIRAMQSLEATRERVPRSLTTHFLHALRPGSAQIEVVAERVGRSMTSLSARVVQESRACVVALAAFAGRYETASYAEPAPRVPPPEDVAPADPADPSFTIFPRLDLRQTFGSPPGAGGDSAENGGWTTLREPQPLSFPALALYADVWWPTPWGRLDHTTAAPTVDLTLHFRQAPPADADRRVLTRFVSRTAADGFFEADGLMWSADGTLLVQSRQLALLREPR
jgi:acyl-CoA thioesterase